MKKLLIFVVVMAMSLTMVWTVSANDTYTVPNSWSIDFEDDYYKNVCGLPGFDWMMQDAASGNKIAEFFDVTHKGHDATYYPFYINYVGGDYVLRLLNNTSLASKGQWDENYKFKMNFYESAYAQVNFAGVGVRTLRDANGKLTHAVNEPLGGFTKDLGPIVGDSGIFISFSSNAANEHIRIYVVNFEDPNAAVQGGYWFTDYVIEGYPAFGELYIQTWASLEVIDEDGVCKFMYNDKLLASVEYSNLVNGIYKTAVIKDANGVEKARTDHAVISEKGNLTISTFDSDVQYYVDLNIDDLTFTKEAAPEPEAPLTVLKSMDRINGVQPEAGDNSALAITEGDNISVLGWAITSKGLFDIKYSIDGAEGISLTPTRSRADVLAAVGYNGPDLAAADKVGFGTDAEHAVIDTSKLAAGDHVIKLTAYSNTGEAIDFYTINLTVNANAAEPEIPSVGDFGLISLAIASLSAVALRKKKEN